MAYLAQDDKQQDPNAQQQSASGAGSSAPVVGNSSGGPAVSTAGVRAGGASPWTNIQSYLNANQGNTGSANLLTSKVGGAYDQESQNEKTQASAAKDQSGQAVQKNKIGQDQASQLVQNLGSQYQYNQPQTADYTQGTQNLHNQLFGAYSGPQNFDYTLSGQTQQYGTNMGNDPGFTATMNGLYRGNANGPVGSGALALQNQLDTQSPELQAARQAMLQRYSGLQSDIANDVSATNTAIGANKDQYAADQKSSQDYFQNTLGKQYKTGLDSAVDKANADEAAIAAQTNNRTMLDPDNQANYKHSVLLGRYLGGGNSERTTSEFNPNDYMSYTGHQATAQNIDDTADRNNFNTIEDVMGTTGGKINMDANPYTHGGWGLNDQAVRKAFAAFHPDRDVLDVR